MTVSGMMRMVVQGGVSGAERKGGHTMIRNQPYVILESREVQRGTLLGVRRMGRDLVLWRGWTATSCACG
jgi:hypothetical protein